jgi:outer membrane protein TolC
MAISVFAGHSSIDEGGFLKAPMIKTMKRYGKRVPGLAWALAGLLLFPLFLSAQDESVNLESAIQMALSRNEVSRQADANVQAQEGYVKQARAFFLPTLVTTGTYTRRPFEVVRTLGNTQVAVQNLNALAGVAQLNMIIFDSRSLPTFLSARGNLEAQRFASAESKRQLTFEVSSAFLTTLGTEQLLAAAQHRLEYAKESLDAAKARYAGGLVSVNDVTRAELDYATAVMGITQAQGQVETTYLQLGYLLDASDLLQKKLKSPDILLQSAEAAPGAPDPMIASAQVRRLDLNSLRWMAKAQGALVIEPLLRWLPSLSFVGQYRYTNESGLTGRTTNWNVGLTLSWTVFDGFTRNGLYQQEKALTTVAELSVKASFRQVALDVRNALVSLTSQQASLKQAVVALEYARKNAAEIAQLYRQGLSSALQVADANIQLYDAEVQFVRQRYGLAIAYLNLEAAQGLDPFGKEPQL